MFNPHHIDQNLPVKGSMHWSAKKWDFVSLNLSTDRILGSAWIKFPL